MRKESLVRGALVVIVFLALFLYHITNTFAPTDPNWFSLFRLSQFAVIVAFVGFAVWSRYVPTMIPFESTPVGKYIGDSDEINVTITNQPAAEPKGLKANETHQEHFSISQNLIETRIDGHSVRAGETQTYSTWFGRRFHSDGNTHYFGIMITTPNAIEFGVLQLTISNGDVAGFYFSGNSDSTKTCRLTARRTAKYTQEDMVPAPRNI